MVQGWAKPLLGRTPKTSVDFCGEKMTKHGDEKINKEDYHIKNWI
jgi:hypothetical protein